jgi:putative DNA primase/helicase
MEKIANDPYLPPPLGCLKDQKVWVGMEVGSTGKKLPINPFTGGLASCSNSNTWATFTEAKKVFQADASSKYRPQYLGLVLLKEMRLFAVDMDNVRDPATGALDPLAVEIIDQLNSYTEISQSGRGVHIYGWGTKTTKACRRENMEVYDSSRIMTITNNPLGEVRPL